VSYMLFKAKWPARFSTIFSFIAYASYCMYLFHRPFWLGLSKLYHPASKMGEQIFNTASIPLLIVLCFYLQKGYDVLIDSTKKKGKPIAR
jgi:peptidoglycan/LPS O-acetylase OafA/YrhL